MKRIELKSKIYAIVGDDLRTNFDTDRTTVSIKYEDETIPDSDPTTISLIMSQEFIADTLGTRKKLTELDKRQVAEGLANRIFQKCGGVPHKIRSVLALKEYAPLIYTSEIDMKPTTD